MKKKRIDTVIHIIFLGLFLYLVTQGKMVIWLALFAISWVGALLFGRFYCGYMCPMNTVIIPTEWVAKKLKLQTKSVPRWLQSKALPWIILAIMAISMVISKKIVGREVPMLLILLGLSIVVTLRYEQWVFHNHLCPFGALLSLTGKHPLFGTVVNEDLCIGCKKCEKVCPSKAILVDKETKKAIIDPSICHQCRNCIVVCPKDAIRYTKC